jgi:hypothetical protein
MTKGINYLSENALYVKSELFKVSILLVVISPSIDCLSRNDGNFNAMSEVPSCYIFAPCKLPMSFIT